MGFLENSVLGEGAGRMVGWITESSYFAQFSGFLIRAAVILVLARILIQVLRSVIRRIFASRRQWGLDLDMEEARFHTLEGLMISAVKYTVYFVAATVLLHTAGVQVGALIATAGVGGLALGFGAQNLVRDVITGFFILFENQYSVGDYVEINGSAGIVEDMAIRITRIRDFAGDLHIIPNGSIGQVTNRSRGRMRSWVNISIAYEEDIDRALSVLREESERLARENEHILEGPMVLGVTDLGDSEVVLSVLAYCTTMEQWAMEREMRRTFKLAFDREGIEIPYPRRVIYQRGENSQETEE